jgi:hypothetical protein
MLASNHLGRGHDPVTVAGRTMWRVTVSMVIAPAGATMREE